MGTSCKIPRFHPLLSSCGTEPTFSQEVHIESNCIFPEGNLYVIQENEILTQKSTCVIYEVYVKMQDNPYFKYQRNCKGIHTGAHKLTQIHIHCMYAFSNTTFYSKLIVLYMYVCIYFC